jgi:60 kDa SS-A/Ro ribonucleoprotein
VGGIRLPAGARFALPPESPFARSSVPPRSDTLNIGGFSDAVFRVVAAFLAEDAGQFVAEVQPVEL